MPPLDSDFCITIDFKKESENPSRIFQAMVDLIQAFQKLDKDLIRGIDSKLEPTILLEDVESGSLRTWLKSIIEGVPDEVLKDGDWKKILGHFLVKVKYIVINRLENTTDITDASVIETIQRDIHIEASKTDVKMFPYYEPIPVPKLINNIDRINKSLSYLQEGDTATYESNITDKASFNLSLNFSPERIEDLLTKESLSNTAMMILKVKKPDYLGNSMWEFRHQNKSFHAKILDNPWLFRFQKRQIDIRPGDSIRAMVNVIVRYGHDNNVLSTHYEINEVVDVIGSAQVNPKIWEEE